MLIFGNDKFLFSHSWSWWTTPGRQSSIPWNLMKQKFSVIFCTRNIMTVKGFSMILQEETKLQSLYLWQIICFWNIYIFTIRSKRLKCFFTKTIFNVCEQTASSRWNDFAWFGMCWAHPEIFYSIISIIYVKWQSLWKHPYKKLGMTFPM